MVPDLESFEEDLDMARYAEFQSKLTEHDAEYERLTKPIIVLLALTIVIALVWLAGVMSDNDSFASLAFRALLASAVLLFGAEARRDIYESRRLGLPFDDPYG